MFKSAWLAGFKAMSSTGVQSQLTPAEINEFCEECAKTFAENVLSQMDTDGDGIYLFINTLVILFEICS